MRPGDELGVIAFWSTAVVLRPLSADPRVDVVVDRLCDLRGGGTTDLELALRTAAAQIARSRAADRQVLLLSDGVATDSPDPVNAASALARIPRPAAGAGALRRGGGDGVLRRAGRGRWRPGRRAAPAESGAVRRPGAAGLSASSGRRGRAAGRRRSPGAQRMPPRPRMPRCAPGARTTSIHAQGFAGRPPRRTTTPSPQSRAKVCPRRLSTSAPRRTTLRRVSSGSNGERPAPRRARRAARRRSRSPRRRGARGGRRSGHRRRRTPPGSRAARAGRRPARASSSPAAVVAVPG